jgi:hypothetical protein
MNPIWRPIGCVIILTLAAGGYIGAGWFLVQNAQNNWIPIPAELVEVPIAPGLPDGFVFKLLIALVAMIIGYGLLSIIFAIIFPIQPGEFDHPPLRSSPRRKK